MTEKELADEIMRIYLRAQTETLALIQSRPADMAGGTRLSLVRPVRNTKLRRVTERVMSTSIRQERNADLKREDPEQLLDVSEAAALLHVKGKTLYAWVSRNKIPYRKICSLVRFHRGELIEWSKGQQNTRSTKTPKAITVVK